MTLTQIYDAVLAESLRSDKAALITRSVVAVVLSAHMSDYYYRDRVLDNNVTPVAAGTDITINLPTRFRKFDSIEVLAPDTGARLGIPVGMVNSDNIYRADGTLTPYYYHVMGNEVKIHGANSIGRLGWTYFQSPDLSSMGGSTWITTAFPEEIIGGVLLRLYRSLGDSATANLYYPLWQEFIERLRADYLLEEL